MTSDEAVQIVVRALNTAQTDYLLAGSFSSNAYGIPRSTKDADFVVQVELAAVVDVIRRLGSPFRISPQIGFETVTGTTKLVATIDGLPFKLEFFLLSDDPHDRERFARRVRREFLGDPVFLPTPEDVIVTKLRWSKLGRRRKDVDDVANVIGVQGRNLDWRYIQRWCDQHGTRALLDEIRRSVPPIE